MIQQLCETLHWGAGSPWSAEESLRGAVVPCLSDSVCRAVSSHCAVGLVHDVFVLDLVPVFNIA